MRRLTTYLSGLVLVLWTSMALAGAILNKFTARSSNGEIILEWTTGEEKDVKWFEVQRKAGFNSDYATLDKVNPKGSNSSYEFVDKSAYKTGDTIYKYRLSIVSNDGTTYSQELIVPHTVSSVKRTWGSIKAMFR